MKIKYNNSIQKNGRFYAYKKIKNSQTWEFLTIYFFKRIKMAIDNNTKRIPITINKILSTVDKFKPVEEVEVKSLTVVGVP